MTTVLTDDIVRGIAEGDYSYADPVPELLAQEVQKLRRQLETLQAHHVAAHHHDDAESWEEGQARLTALLGENADLRRQLEEKTREVEEAKALRDAAWSAFESLGGVFLGAIPMGIRERVQNALIALGDALGGERGDGKDGA